MPPRNARSAPFRAFPRCFIWLALALGAVPAAAQTLPFQRDYPGSTPFECRPFASPVVASAEARAQAGQLASTAAQAVLLGDLERADALLERATELDPASADLAYRRARVLENRGALDDATEEYCRSLALLDSGDTAEDARARLDALVAAETEQVPSQAVAAFEMGLEAADGGAMEEALEAFRVAEAEGGDWPAATYNRGVTLERLGRPAEAAQALSYYLELLPDAPDALAVSRRIGQLQSLAVTSGPSPGTALTLGILMPGLGHFYSGRTGGGLTVLTLAAGAVAAGFLMKEVDVTCLTPQQGACPPDQVVSRTTTRPYLTASLAAAAAVGIAGAIEAFVDARGRRGSDSSFPDSADDAGLVVLPGLGVRQGKVELGLLGLRFR
ncbi:MAG: tetratricopeptide repeat protein [Gemmatimonadota bacterium]